jgi:phosphate transport system substrate-binding protein
MLMASFAAAAIACGGNEPSSSETPGSNLSGEILIDGSSTVFPITQAVAEEFRAAGNTGVQVVVGVSGTGGGFKRFVTGETAISNASRSMKDSEAEIAKENGVEYIELRVALDGLSVIVNLSNRFVTCLTTAELNKIWNPESTLNSWKQVRVEFPNDELRLYGPGTDSGTFDFFTDKINGAEGASRADFTPSENDNVLVLGIAGDKNALGYFGYAYYVENSKRLRVIAIDSGNGCVEPTPETINDGSYAPLSRPVFIYINKAELARPEVKAFVEFYMQMGGELAEEVGYVALPANVYKENIAAIQ